MKLCNLNFQILESYGKWCEQKCITVVHYQSRDVKAELLNRNKRGTLDKFLFNCKQNYSFD